MEDTIKVLLIEDNPQDAKFIQEELSGGMDIFFNVITVSTLQDGFSNINNGNIDLILSDLGLPDSTGIDTYIKLYEKTKTIPIIILSSNKDEELALSAVRKGAQDYLVKGDIDSKLLQKSIKYAIEKHKLYRELEQAKAELERYKKLGEYVT